MRYCNTNPHSASFNANHSVTSREKFAIHKGLSLPIDVRRMYKLGIEVIYFTSLQLSDSLLKLHKQPKLLGERRKNVDARE